MMPLFTNNQKWRLFRNINLIILSIVFLGGCSVMQPLQKRKLLGVFHLIETARFSEAKILVDELVEDKEASKWPNTWYARGVLCQNAYREGIRRNDRNLSNLYPDQLFVAFESFTRAEMLDKRGRFRKQIAPRYVLLANDLQVSGENHFKNKKYDDAFRAFEKALEISRKPVLSLQPDTNLIYNTALAAFESKNWNAAIRYFGILHEAGHSPNVTHLLFKAHMQTGSATAAEKTLKEGIKSHRENQSLVLLLVDLYCERNDTTRALQTLRNAISTHPENHVYHYTKGLINQKARLYNNAIEAYTRAVELDPAELMSHINIATCYYNIGVEIEEAGRSIMNSAMAMEKKRKAEEAFAMAVSWLDKAYEQKPQDKDVLSRLYNLYNTLRITDKASALEKMAQ